MVATVVEVDIQSATELGKNDDQGAFEHSAIGQVGDAAAGGGNLVPPIIGAVEAQATVGEISDTLRVAFGAHQETATV